MFLEGRKPVDATVKERQPSTNPERAPNSLEMLVRKRARVGWVEAGIATGRPLPLRKPALRENIMFERYTEKARRVIFFARYEASQFGSPYIETEHLLLGLLREDKALTNRFLRSHASVESIRKQIEAHTTI